MLGSFKIVGAYLLFFSSSVADREDEEKLF